MRLQVISDKIHTNFAITYTLEDTTSVGRIFGTFDVFYHPQTKSMIIMTLFAVVRSPYCNCSRWVARYLEHSSWRKLHEIKSYKSRACSSYWLMCGTRSEGRKTPIIFILENPDVWGSHGREPKGMQRTNLLGRASRSTIGFVSALSRSHKRPE